MHNSKQKNILVITAQESGLTPGQRFRFEQYIEYLKENGVNLVLSPLLKQAEIKMLYAKGNLIGKVKLILKSFFIRHKDVRRIRKNEFDAIFIIREALMIGSTYYEKKMHKTGYPIVFDFDDSIWLQDVSDANKKFNWLKNPAKTGKNIKLSRLVIAGNEYLENYARQFNHNTVIIPTTIDTKQYTPFQVNKNTDKAIIGWSGSITTIKHFKTITSVLEIIKDKYKDKVEIHVIGDGNYVDENLGIKGKWWNAETEIFDLCNFDIGIMPLPDDEWSKGKCGLKGLQYMALEIPTIMSPVGVNSEIIQNGVNGFLAATHEEWIEKLSLLIENPELRIKLGKEGRKTVVEKYSFDSQKERYLKVFQSVIEEKSKQ